MIGTGWRQFVSVGLAAMLMMGGLSVGQARADSKTAARIIAGLAVGALVYEALGDHHRDRCYVPAPEYCPPPVPCPRYVPPDCGYYPGPGRVYNYGYQDGYQVGIVYGHSEGYAHGYRRDHRDRRYVDHRHYWR